MAQRAGGAEDYGMAPSRPARRLPAAALLTFLVLALCATWLARPAAAGATTSSPAAAATSQTAVDLLAWELAAYAGPMGGFANGIWNSPNTVCWSCNQGGPASAAAALYMVSGRTQPRLLQEAESTIDTAIATRQQANGSFVGPAGDTQSPDVATMFFGVEEGNTYLTLLPVLDPARRARWQASISAAASFLIHNGNLNWYTNGNINLGNTELFYLAWRATGSPIFQAVWQQSWNFTLSPPQAQWPGRGLVMVKAPTRPDWSDGAGYLSETGAGGTGFDAEYTALQLDEAARLYLLSGDPRALRLANVLVNMVIPHIKSNWWLDTSGGTRHTQAGREVPLLSSAFAVLALDGGRADLLGDIAPALHEAAATIADPANSYGEVYRRALGSDISVIALAATLAHPVGWAAGVATPSAPTAVSPVRRRGSAHGATPARLARTRARHRSGSGADRQHRDVRRRRRHRATGGWYPRRSVH